LILILCFVFSLSLFFALFCFLPLSVNCVAIHCLLFPLFSFLFLSINRFVFLLFRFISFFFLCVILTAFSFLCFFLNYFLSLTRRDNLVQLENN
jgi:hypothetical protein